MSHSIAPIPLITAYFGDERAAPIVTAEYRPTTGWHTTGYAKRISHAWARKLLTEGVTFVQLTFADRAADFSLAEILRSH